MAKRESGMFYVGFPGGRGWDRNSCAGERGEGGKVADKKELIREEVSAGV